MLLSSDPAFHFNLLRWLGIAPYRGADVAEILDVADRIVPGDFESWHREFFALAEHVEREGWDRVQSSPVTVRDRAFRAASYYRAADFFLHGDPGNPRITSTWASAIDRRISVLARGDRHAQQSRPLGRASELSNRERRDNQHERNSDAQSIECAPHRNTRQRSRAVVEMV